MFFEAKRQYLGKIGDYHSFQVTYSDGVTSFSSVYNLKNMDDIIEVTFMALALLNQPEDILVEGE